MGTLRARTRGTMREKQKAWTDLRRGATFLLAGGIAAGALVTPQSASAAVPVSVSTATYARSAPLPTTTYAVVETISVGLSPGAIAIDQDDDTIYIANSDSDTVSIVRGSDYEVVDTIAVGDRPCDLAVDSDDDTLYVANHGGGTLSVIEGRSVDDSETIALGLYPCGVGVNQGDDTVYVLNSNDSGMSVINGRSLDDSVTISVGHWPQGVAVDQTDDTVYVTNYWGTLSVLNGRWLDDSVTIGGFNDPIFWVAVNDTDDTVYVPNSGGTLSVINGRALDDSSLINGFGGQGGIAVNQVDGRVYVANWQDDPGDDPGIVSVIDGRTGSGIDDTIAVGGNPAAVARSVTTGVVYVSSLADNTVSVISDVTPSLDMDDTTGIAGDTVTLYLSGPQDPNDPPMDDSTVTSVYFNGVPVSRTPISWSPSSGNSIDVQVPPGSGMVDVTVAFNGGNSASAGTFTYVSPGAPGTPYGWTGSGQATIKWASPDITGAAPVTDYVLEWATSPSGPWDDSITVPGARASVTGLANGTAYRFRVSAVNAFGTGPASNLSSPLTPRAFANWTYTLDDTIVLPEYSAPTAVALTDDTAFVTIARGKVVAIRLVDDALVGDLASVGASPVGIAVTPDGSKAYVVNQGQGNFGEVGYRPPSVSVINTRTQLVTGTILDPKFFTPQGVVATDDTVYVTNFRWFDSRIPVDNPGFVSVIRTRDDTVVESITNSAIQAPYAVALTPDLSRLYVADLLTCLTVVDSRTNAVMAAAAPAGCVVPVAVAATDDTIFLANKNAGSVSVIRRSDNTPVGSPIGVGANPSGIAVSPDGTRIYVSTGLDILPSSVSVIDTSTNTVVATVVLPDGASPMGLAVNTDGSRIYVPGYGTGRVYVIGVRPVPGTPTIDSATAGDGSASVSWTVDDTGGLALTRMNFALDDTTNVDDSTTNTTGPHTLTDLTNGTTYRVYVQAVNANGAGPWSLASSPFTPVGPSAPPAPPSQVPTIAPASQSLSGVARSSVRATAAFRADGFASTPRYSIYPTLPAGLSIDPATGVVSGTPTVAYPSTRHWITATVAGGSQSATALLQVHVAEAPEPPPTPTATLVITGTRQELRSKPGIRVTGTATNLDPGTMLRPWIRFPGQASFTQGTAQIPIDDHGKLDWQRATRKKTYIYLRTQDGQVQSNRIAIPRFTAS